MSRTLRRGIPAQERTALADTPGSLFITEAESFLAESRYLELLDTLVGKLDTLFSKASDGASMLRAVENSYLLDSL